MGDEVIETERKYAVGPGFRVPGLAGLPGVGEVTAPRRYRLTAVYFDTEGCTLAQANITLRRRTGGADVGWHLKLPAAQGAAPSTTDGTGEPTLSRREIHAPLRRGGDGVPPPLLARVAPWLGGQPVSPVARVRTSRTVRRLLGASGRALAEIADDRVTGLVPDRAGGESWGEVPAWREVAAWREVEAELVAGTAALLDGIGARLLAAGAKPSRAGSKLALVLAAAGFLPAAGDRVSTR